GRAGQGEDPVADQRTETAPDRAGHRLRAGPGHAHRGQPRARQQRPRRAAAGHRTRRAPRAARLRHRRPQRHHRLHARVQGRQAGRRKMIRRHRSRGLLRSAVFTAILCVVAGGAFAADAGGFPATPPAPGPAPQLNVPVPTAQTLPNGLVVVSVRRAGLPLVTAQLVLRSGGEMDPTNEAGLADLTANLLTKGAGGKSAPQIAAAAEALGGSLQAAAGWDESAVGITVTTPKLPKALDLLATVVRHPDFAPDELKRAQAQAADDLRLALSRPIALASLAAGRAVFGDGAYGHSRTGTPASIARITRANVERLHAELYRPDNAILVLAGDITPAQAAQLAQASFGDWKKPATPLPAKPKGSTD